MALYWAASLSLTTIKTPLGLGYSYQMKSKRKPLRPSSELSSQPLSRTIRHFFQQPYTTSSKTLVVSPLGSSGQRPTAGRGRGQGPGPGARGPPPPPRDNVAPAPRGQQHRKAGLCPLHRCLCVEPLGQFFSHIAVMNIFSFAVSTSLSMEEG